MNLTGQEFWSNINIYNFRMWYIYLENQQVRPFAFILFFSLMLTTPLVSQWLLPLLSQIILTQSPNVLTNLRVLNLLKFSFCGFKENVFSNVPINIPLKDHSLFQASYYKKIYNI